MLELEKDTEEFYIGFEDNMYRIDAVKSKGGIIVKYYGPNNQFVCSMSMRYDDEAKE